MTILLRKRRREIVNEFDVVTAIRDESGRQGLLFEPVIIDLDGVPGIPGMPLHKALEIISDSLGIVGVHGAGLTNAIFLPPISVLIELRVGYPRAPFRQLCKQFELAYLEFPRTYMSDIGTNWTLGDDRDRKVVVDDVTGLASLVSFGAMRITRIRRTLPPLFLVKG